MSITEIQISKDSLDNSSLIKLGEISYINCEIFNYPLNKIIHSQNLKNEGSESGLDAFKIKIVTGVPSHLNKLFEEGLIDAAPISSFAYLKIKEQCKLLKRISISAFGKVKSVLFFSNQNFKELKTKRN